MPWACEGIRGRWDEKCSGHAQEYGGDGMKNAEGMRGDWVRGVERDVGVGVGCRVPDWN